MSQNKNNGSQANYVGGSHRPLSCTRGIHFFKQVGDEVEQCMYCNAMFLQGKLIHQGNVDQRKVVMQRNPDGSNLVFLPAGCYNIKIKKHE